MTDSGEAGGSGGSGEVAVIVAVDPEVFDDAAGALRDAGVRIADENRELGTVAGAVRADRLAALAGLTGVQAVERDRDVSLPRPGDPQ